MLALTSIIRVVGAERSSERPSVCVDGLRCRTWWVAGCRMRDGHVEVDAAVRPGGVVVRDVPGQDVFEVAAVPDQDLVEAFGPYGAYPAWRPGVR